MYVYAIVQKLLLILPKEKINVVGQVSQRFASDFPWKITCMSLNIKANNKINKRHKGNN